MHQHCHCCNGFEIIVQSEKETDEENQHNASNKTNFNRNPLEWRGLLSSFSHSLYFSMFTQLTEKRQGNKEKTILIQPIAIDFVRFSLSLSLVLVSYFWLHVVLSHPKKTSSSWRSFLFIFPLNVSSRTDSLIFSYYCCNLYALFKRFSIETAIFRVTLCECVLRTARLQSIILHITPTCRALGLFRDAKKKKTIEKVEHGTVRVWIFI